MRGVLRILFPAIAGVLAAGLAVAAPGNPADAPPPAGSSIQNRASISFVDASGATVLVDSNIVTAIVSGREGLSLLPDRSLTRAAGAPFLLVHELANTGNIALSATLTAQNLPGDGFDAADLEVTLDADGNGRVDPGEPTIPPGGLVTLPAGGTAQLILTGTIPPFAPPGTIARLELRAISVAEGRTAHVTDTLELPAAPPVIRYFTSEEYTRVAPVGSMGRPLFVQGEAAACNRDASVVETREITLRSAGTGDEETFVAIETGPGTGTFRVEGGVPAIDAAGAPAVPGNGMIETMADDRIDAEIDGCAGGSARASTSILIDPFGVVFDSRTGEPVAGASVTIVDLAAGGSALAAAGGASGGAVVAGAPGAATVFEVDQVTPAPSTIMTGADGRFRFPFVLPKGYRMVVTAPRGFRSPSAVPAADQPAGRRIDPQGSFLKDFTVAALAQTIRFDIPLDPDPASASGLFVRKSASVSEVEIGDFVDWTVETRNVSGIDVTSTTIVDVLPAGHVHERGTTRRAGARAADPAGGHGPVLVFEGGPLAADASVVVVYRTRVGPGAMRGDGVNRARATAPAAVPLVSNIATARVKSVEDVFTDKGFIFGKVYLDGNRSREQDDDGEPGVPGVRIYLEDGTWIVTDSEGKFIFYGVTPRTHVVKVDRTTLPEGAVLELIANRQMGDAGSRFADVKAGEMHRADFAIVDPEGKARPIIERRRERLKDEDPLLALSRVVDATLATGRGPDAGALAADPRSLPASGVVGGPGGQGHEPAGARSIVPRDAGGPARSNLPSPRPAAAAKVDLKTLLPSLEPGLGFLDWRSGDTLPSTQARVRVKGAPGAPFALFVDGVEVPESRIGMRVLDAARGVEAREYVGVSLRPGVSTVTLVQQDPFGNERGRVEVRVSAPGDLARLRIALARAEAPADGATVVPVRITLEDRSGVTVTARTPVTIECSLGALDALDLDPALPGAQLFIEDGLLDVSLTAPGEPGLAALRASSGPLEARASVAFVPDLRPLIMTGLVEGKLALRNISSGSFRPTSREDGFERELRRLSRESADGKVKAGARAALFLKGKIPGDALLTAAYDSEKDTKERLFRDIQPDRFYPVYGDASTKGFDAQSTSELYVRIDRNRSWLLYGDIQTGDQSDLARKLGAYDRSLTGGKAHVDEGPVSGNAWATRDTLRQVVDEVRANGTSGFYQLSRAGFLENSEKVEVLTRDRNQPAIILRSAPMSRFADYEIEPLTGRLLFRRPIPSLDENLNPISIRVTYEVDQGGERYWIHGADVKVKVHERVEVGGAIAREEAPGDRKQVASANGAVKIGEGTTILAEVAESRTVAKGKGHAGRVELQHRSESLEARVHASRSGEAFENRSSGMPGGRTEAGAKGAAHVAEKTRVLAEALYTEDTTTHGRRYGALGGVEQGLGDWVRVEAGLRWAHETRDAASADTAQAAGATPNDLYAARIKLTVVLPFLPEAEVYVEGEQDVIRLDRHLLAIGGSYRIDEKTRVYGRTEVISSLGGQYAMNGSQSKSTTVVGLDSEYMKDGRAFTEYRARDAFAGRDAEAAMGLRNLWTLSERIRLHTSLEWLNPLHGSTESETAAATGAVEYVNDPVWKGTARLELRYGEQQNGLLSSAGLGWKVSREWTLLTRGLLSIDDGKHGRGNKTIGRAQIGAAWREVDENHWSALFRVEEKYEDDRTGGAGLEKRRDVVIWSSHVSFHPTPAWVISGRVAGKALQDRSAGINSRSLTHLFQARTTVDLTDRFDVGFTGSALTSGDLRSVDWGLGAEVGCRVFQNMWVSLGYNAFGWKDRDLAGDEETEQGVFVGFRFKFDEETLEDAGS